MARQHIYNIYVKNLDGKIWEILPKSWEFTDELNHESTASFSVSFQDFQKIATATSTTIMAIFTSSFREIWVERDGIKIFWGVLTGFDVSPTADGEMTISLKATSWFGLFQKRIAGIPIRQFASTDAGQIAWTLIDESQAADPPYSDFGIIQGSITTSKDRDRTYKFDIIKDQIINLSNDNLDEGFDFDIDNTKAFNVYYPQKGNDRFNIVFDFNTVASFKFSKPSVFDLVNTVFVVGAGENDDVLFATQVGDIANREQWHTLEEKNSQTDIIELSTLQDKGNRRLAEAQTPIVEFSVDHYDDQIEWESYQLGDNVKANFPILGMDLETKRVRSRKFKMDADKSIGIITSVLK